MLDLDKLYHHIQVLDKGDDTSRRQAIHSLRDYGEQEWATAPLEVIQSLVKSLQHQLLYNTKQISIRQQAVIVLGNMGPRSEPAIPQLIELLREDIPDGVREAAATSLGKIGKTARVAVDQLINVLLQCRPTLAVQAVRALGDIGCADQRVRNALVNLWLSPTKSPNSQGPVAFALCKLKIDATGLLRFLTSGLVANQDASLRKSAAEALAWCSKNEIDVVPALLTAALNDKDDKVRQMAEAGLAQLHLSHEKAIHLCSMQLKGSFYAEAALRNSGQLAVPTLIEALGTEDSIIREKAARILGCLGEVAAAAVPALTMALHDKNLVVRLAAAKGLWNITKNAEVVVPVMVDLLKEKWAAVADAGESRRRHLQTVIEALQRIGPSAKTAITALTDKTKDENRHVCQSALRALKGIAPTVANTAGLR